MRKQPGSALFLVLYKTITQLLRMLWPLLLFYLVKPAGKSAKIDPWEIAVAGSSMLILLNSIILFYTFRFRVQGEELLVKKGYIVRTQLVLPLNRIQAVHIDENWLHQLLDLAQVTVDSPGTEKAEVRIIMRKHEAEAFRLFISDRKADEEMPVAAKPADNILFQLSTADLIRLGISSNHLEAFFLMLAFAFSTLDNLERAFSFEFSGFLRWLSDLAASSTASALGLTAIAVLILSIILSLLRTTLQYGRFEISETDNGYRIQSGLINLKEKLIPYNKVQYISWKANWLRSRLPIYLLHFHAIGDENMKRKWTIHIPITQKEFITRLLAYYHPAIASREQYLRIHRKYIIRRIWLAGLLPALLVMAPTFFIWEWKVLWCLLWPAYTCVSAILFQKKFRLFLDDEALQIRRGVFGWENIVLCWKNIQSVSLRQGIYQRRHQLATLRLYTADRHINIPFLNLADAQRLRDYAIAKIEWRER